MRFFILLIPFLVGCSNLDPRSHEIYHAKVVQVILFQDDGVTTKSLLFVSEQARFGPSPLLAQIRFDTKEKEASAGREAGSFWNQAVSSALTIIGWVTFGKAGRTG